MRGSDVFSISATSGAFPARAVAEVKALVELRIPFELDRQAIDDVERGADPAGGFEHNQQMREQYLPQPTDARWSAAAGTNTGDAHRAAMAATAAYLMRSELRENWEYVFDSSRALSALPLPEESPAPTPSDSPRAISR